MRYFAIASMMNPLSLWNRQLIPTSSSPGLLLDYRLRFFAPMGYAEAVHEKGAQFHGVIHTLTESQMDLLDDYEGHLYQRTEAVACLYGNSDDAETQEEVSVWVYCRKENAEGIVDSTPQQRYLEIMIEGARHYGVSDDYIRQLQALPSEPSPTPDEFLSFGDPPDKTFTIPEIMAQDGKEGRPLFAAINGKVLDILNPTMERTGMLRKMRDKTESPAAEDWFPKIVYDPLCGTPAHRNDCTREHAAYVEHVVVKRLGQDKVNVAGKIEQAYRD